MTKKIILAWSGGKDSALALRELGKSKEYEVVCLLCTITSDFMRVSMHGVRSELINIQAEHLGKPLEKVLISKDGDNSEYESRMSEVLSRYKNAGIQAVAFGDIFLEDVRKYREDHLAQMGMKAVFPLWGRDTTRLANEFIDNGFEAVVTCVDSHYLGKEFVGRIFNRQFLADLPSGVDDCGENGEFHTFVYRAPFFLEKIENRLGDIVYRESRFYYCDVMNIPKMTRPLIK
ncbi:MAG: diphthine--ammonia ligase [Candidatus Omnitrophica bacterium]|nr:diphthine--ammonia ligase [Candidatus Omnitrophota bacterium]